MLMCFESCFCVVFLVVDVGLLVVEAVVVNVTVAVIGVVVVRLQTVLGIDWRTNFTSRCFL